jgi:hypothetical protein
MAHGKPTMCGMWQAHDAHFYITQGPPRKQLLMGVSAVRWLLWSCHCHSSRCGVVSDEVGGAGGVSCLPCGYPATWAPWDPLTPNNPLTSHLNREEKVGVAMAMAGVARARADSQHNDAGAMMVTADTAVAMGGHGKGDG